MRERGAEQDGERRWRRPSHTPAAPLPAGSRPAASGRGWRGSLPPAAARRAWVSGAVGPRGAAGGRTGGPRRWSGCAEGFLSVAGQQSASCRAEVDGGAGGERREEAQPPEGPAEAALRVCHRRLRAGAEF